MSIRWVETAVYDPGTAVQGDHQAKHKDHGNAKPL